MHLCSQMFKAAVRSKAVVLSGVFSHCLWGPVFGPCFVMQHLVSFLVLQ